MNIQSLIESAQKGRRACELVPTPLILQLWKYSIKSHLLRCMSCKCSISITSDFQVVVASRGSRTIQPNHNIQYPSQKRAGFRIVERPLYCKNVHSKTLLRRYGVVPKMRVVRSFNRRCVPENGRTTDEPFRLLPYARSVRAIVFCTRICIKRRREPFRCRFCDFSCCLYEFCCHFYNFCQGESR